MNKFKYSRNDFLRYMAMLVGLFVVLSTSRIVEADEESNVAPEPHLPAYTYSPASWGITPGVGVRVVTLDVRRKSDGYKGRLTNDGSFSDPIYFSIDLESPAYMVSPTLGFSLRANAQTFNISRQEISSSTTSTGYDYADLGTSVHGYYSYFGPQIFYRMADKNGDSRFGLGYGMWKAWFNGDIILGPKGDVNSSMPRTSVSDSIKDTMGPILYWQAHGQNMLFEISISQVSFSNARYETSLQELGMSVGYYISF